MARQSPAACERLVGELPAARNLTAEPIRRLKGTALADRAKLDFRRDQAAVRPGVNVQLDGVAIAGNPITPLGDARGARQGPEGTKGRFGNFDFSFANRRLNGGKEWDGADTSVGFGSAETLSGVGTLDVDQLPVVVDVLPAQRAELAEPKASAERDVEQTDVKGVRFVS